MKNYRLGATRKFVVLFWTQIPRVGTTLAPKMRSDWCIERPASKSSSFSFRQPNKGKMPIGAFFTRAFAEFLD